MQVLQPRTELGRIHRDAFGCHYAAMTVIEVAGSLEDTAQIEVETTSIIPG